MNGPFQSRVLIAKYGARPLTSRSEASIVLQNIGQARHVVLDFDGITHVGSDFVDEIFHVYAERHPDVRLAYMNVTPKVRRAIKDAVACKRQEQIGSKERYAEFL